MATTNRPTRKSNSDALELLDIAGRQPDSALTEITASHRADGFANPEVADPDEHNYVGQRRQSWFLAAQGPQIERRVATITVGGTVDQFDKRRLSVSQPAAASGIPFNVDYTTSATDATNADVATGWAAAINADTTARQYLTARASGADVIIEWLAAGQDCTWATSIVTDAGTADATATLVETNDLPLAIRVPDDYAADEIPILVGSHEMESTASADASRMWFDPNDGSFRAGRATGTEWDSANRGARSAAFGDNCEASGDDSFAAGDGSTSAASQSTAIGVSASAAGVASAAIGDGASTGASGQSAIALGHDASATQLQAAALGDSATASGISSTAVGKDATASGAASIALGDGATASDTSATAVGDGATASGARSLAGPNATASGDDSIAIGDGSVVSGDDSVAIGQTNTVSHATSYAVGAGNVSAGVDNFLFGENNAPTGSEAYAIGVANTPGGGGFAFGVGCYPSGNDTVAIGNTAGGAATSGVAIGDRAQVQDTSAIALGHEALTAWASSVARNSGDEHSAKGDIRAHDVVVSCQTTDGSATALQVAGLADQMDLLDSTTYTFTASIAAYVTAGTLVDKGFGAFIRGAIRVNGAGALTLLGSQTDTFDGESTSFSTGVDVTAGYLRITVTGAASQDVNWTGDLHVAECGGAR